MEVLAPARMEDLDVRDATFTGHDLTTFTRVNGLGPRVVGQQVSGERAVLACRMVAEGLWCRRCGCEEVVLGSVRRRLALEPFGWRVRALDVVDRRYRRARVRGRCGARTPPQRRRRGPVVPGSGLHALVVERMSIVRIAAGVGVSWNAANTAVLDEGRRRLIEDPKRLDGVTVTGIDEHVWRHCQRRAGSDPLPSGWF
ncbi:MAG: hypothetical protein U0Q15_00015 [Kineosporiaceae bacterium]